MKWSVALENRKQAMNIWNARTLSLPSKNKRWKKLPTKRNTLNTRTKSAKKSARNWMKRLLVSRTRQTGRTAMPFFPARQNYSARVNMQIWKKKTLP